MSFILIQISCAVWEKVLVVREKKHNTNKKKNYAEIGQEYKHLLAEESANKIMIRRVYLLKRETVLERKTIVCNEIN